MPLRTLILILLVCAFWSGCNDVMYKQPQPADIPVRQTIPPAYQGIYLLKGGTFFVADEGTEAGESWMRITDTMVYQYAWTDKKVPYLQGVDYDSLNIPEAGDGVQVMISGNLFDGIYLGDDWAQYRVTNYLELAIGDSISIKEDDGMIYLNLRERKQGMELWRLVLVDRLRNGDLTFWSNEDYDESGAEEFFTVEQVRGEGYGSYIPLADPDREELDGFVNSDAFGELVMWMSRDFDRYSVPEVLLK